jgi:hypothetical protein
MYVLQPPIGVARLSFLCTVRTESLIWISGSSRSSRSWFPTFLLSILSCTAVQGWIFLILVFPCVYPSEFLPPPEGLRRIQVSLIRFSGLCAKSWHGPRLFVFPRRVAGASARSRSYLECCLRFGSFLSTGLKRAQALLPARFFASVSWFSHRTPGS